MLMSCGPVYIAILCKNKIRVLKDEGSLKRSYYILNSIAYTYFEI